jgi:Mg2+/Co2+ transporter CorB
MMLFWLALVCLVATMFFSAAEMAFIAANRLRLRHLAEEGNRVAAQYLEAFRNPRAVLSTAMMGVTVAHIIASSVVTFALIPRFGGAAALVATVVLTPVMLVFGEIIPKAVAREWATRLILTLYRPLVWMSAARRRSCLLQANRGRCCLRLCRRATPDVRHFVSREELKNLARWSPARPNVTTQEAEMIDNIFDLGDTTVREVMVPLVDVADAARQRDARWTPSRSSSSAASRASLYRASARRSPWSSTAMDLLRRGARRASVRD